MELRPGVARSLVRYSLSAQQEYSTVIVIGSEVGRPACWLAATRSLACRWCEMTTRPAPAKKRGRKKERMYTIRDNKDDRY